MAFHTILDDICSEYHIGPASQGEQNSACLVFNDDTKINIEITKHTDSLCIFSYLFAGITENKTKELCKHIMAINAYGSRFGPVIISYSENDQLFVASQTFDLMTYEKIDFIIKLKYFIAITKEIKSCCAELLESF